MDEASQLWWVSGQPKLNQTNIDWIDHIYRDRLAAQMQVDVIIDGIIKTLNKYNAIDNTYIIYTSDHGYHLGQWRLPCEKSFIYDTDIRVPFFVRGPGVKAGSISEAIIGNVDIMPTLLDLSGIDGGDELNDGKSFGKQLKGENVENWREYILIEYMAHANQYFNICETWWSKPGDFHGQNLRPEPFADGQIIFVDWGNGEGNEYNPGSNTWREIRIINETDNWSYSEYIDFNWTETAKDNPNLRVLYDVNKDPYQMKNIINEVSKDIQQELHDMLMTYGKCSRQSCP